MLKRLILGAVILLVTVEVARSTPSMVRYIKMRNM